MGITFNKEFTKEKWIDYDEDVKFLIRPFPVSARAIRPAGDFNFVDVLVKQANYVIRGWSGIKDINGNDVPYSDENKQFLLDYSEELVEWACVKSKEINDTIINIKQKKI